MKKTLVFLFIVITSIRVTYADSWGWPTEKGYFFENESYMAHIKPPGYLKEDGPLLEVFEVKQTEKTLLWQCKMGKLRAPLEVYISDNGKYVVSVNEHGRVGYGNYVVAFYNEGGCIDKYTLESILDLPEDTAERELFKLMPHSTTSRWWDQNSIKFFDMSADKLYFCIWLRLFNRWIAWDPTNGQKVVIDKEMVRRWQEKARLWSIEEIKKERHRYSPYYFLSSLRNPDDRRIIENLLTDEDFSQSFITFTTTSGRNKQGKQLVRCVSTSYKRLLAEQVLADWDGRPVDKGFDPSPSQPLYYLGTVEGIISLPKMYDPNAATLWIHLVPNTVTEDQWYEKPPVHRLAACFGDATFRNFAPVYKRKFPFTIVAVTPGRYWVKAVLDRTQPLSKRTDRIYLPQPGDYQNVESPIITVKAGEIVEGITIHCIQEVTSGTD